MTDLSCDVVIVGYGGAGAAAAITAHDAGADVLVLEKANAGGGSTQESGGTFRRFADADQTLEHYLRLTQGLTPRPVMEAFVRGAERLPAWLASLGADVVPFEHDLFDRGSHPVFPKHVEGTAFPEIPFGDGLGHRLRVKPLPDDPGGGAALWQVLDANVVKRRIKVRYNARAHRLLRDVQSGEITGVVVESDDRRYAVQARQAVILTCGGFNYDAALLKEFVGAALPALSPPGRATGDGIRMAQDVGADLWHMNSVAATFGYKFPEYEAAFWCKMPAYGFLVVDRRGRRYIDEASVENHVAALVSLVVDLDDGDYARVPSYIVFDERTRKAGPVSWQGTGYHRHFDWSFDNAREVARGWFNKAETIGDLARQLGVPVPALESAVERYNEGVRSGRDEFGRKPAEMAAVDQPPYYGAPIWPTLFNTQGGPRRDEYARVLNAYGAFIPRLYAAGELGSIWGKLYPGAGNVTEAMVFGQIAGRHAAQLPRR